MAKTQLLIKERHRKNDLMNIGAYARSVYSQSLIFDYGH